MSTKIEKNVNWLLRGVRKTIQKDPIHHLLVGSLDDMWFLTMYSIVKVEKEVLVIVEYIFQKSTIFNWFDFWVIDQLHKIHSMLIENYLCLIESPNGVSIYKGNALSTCFV